MNRRIAWIIALFLSSTAGCRSTSVEASFTAFVVFIADRNTAGVMELFVANADGSEIRNLSGTLVSGGDVVNLQWSPDRTQIAFLADKEVDGRNEL